VEVPFAIDEPGRGQDVEVGVKIEVIAEGVHGSDGGELAPGKIEPGAHPVAQALDADVEDVIGSLRRLRKMPIALPTAARKLP
jgi:hypothetical protein